MSNYTLLQGHCLEVLRTLPAESVQTCVTSPPYFGLRDYGCNGQIGLESTPDAFVTSLVEVFAEVHRVLKSDGTLWLNLGDSYAGKSQSLPGDGRSGFSNNRKALVQRMSEGLKHKDLIGIPWRVAFALQQYGWYLRQDIIWHKPNPMPESVTDRCTKAHEYIFLLSKSDRYYYDYEAIKEDATTPPTIRDKHAEGYQADYVKGDRFSSGARVYGADGRRNKRSVWTVPVKGFPGAHFATYPTELIRPCILAGSQRGDTVLDPFNGSGTTGFVSMEERRKYIGIDINDEYLAIAEARIKSAQVQEQMDF